MDLVIKKEFREETGKDIFDFNEDNEIVFTMEYVNWLESKVKKLSLNNVSQQRELLIAYHKHNTMIRNKELDKFIENYVDDYLSNL